MPQSRWHRGGSAVIGFAARSANQPLGACTLHLGGPIATLELLPNAAGYAQSPALPIIGAPGTAFYAQGFALDPNGPLLGLALTTGHRFALGD